MQEETLNKAESRCAEAYECSRKQHQAWLHFMQDPWGHQEFDWWLSSASSKCAFGWFLEAMCGDALFPDDGMPL